VEYVPLLSEEEIYRCCVAVGSPKELHPRSGRLAFARALEAVMRERIAAANTDIEQTLVLLESIHVRIMALEEQPVRGYVRIYESGRCSIMHHQRKAGCKDDVLPLVAKEY